MTDDNVDAVARSRIDAHEEICAARYLELTGALSAINTRLFGAAGAIIILLFGVIVSLLTRR